MKSDPTVENEKLAFGRNVVIQTGICRGSHVRRGRAASPGSDGASPSTRAAAFRVILRYKLALMC